MPWHFSLGIIERCYILTKQPLRLTSRRSQPPLAVSVPLSRFASRVGGGSAFFVRQHHTPQQTHTMKKQISSLLLACAVALVFTGCATEHHAATARVDRDQCIANLRMLFAAEQEWGLQHHKTSQDTPTWDEVRAYLPSGSIPVCPEGGTYTLGRLDSYPKCSVPGHELPANYGRAH